MLQPQKNPYSTKLYILITICTLGIASFYFQNNKVLFKNDNQNEERAELKPVLSDQKENLNKNQTQTSKQLNSKNLEVAGDPNLKINEKSSRKQLAIYTYSSFTTSWGPGPQLKVEFEKECHCEIKWLSAPDSRGILTKLDFQKENEPVDIILGLDIFDTQLAQNKYEILVPQVLNDANLKWEPNFKNESQQNSPWVPFDWGILAFNTHKNTPLYSQIQKLDDLLNPAFKKSIAIEDPRTSSPGLLFLMWIFDILGDEKAQNYLKSLNSNVHSYGSSWSTSYGLFTQGQAQVVFSYTTSPHYHLLEEKKDNFVALSFAEPLPKHIEYFGILKKCKECQLAQDFSRFLLTEKAQKIIMLKNFMYPVIAGVTTGTPFEDANKYKTYSIKKMEPTLIEKRLQIWKNIQREN